MTWDTRWRIWVYLFTTTVSLQPGKAVASVTLPSPADGQFHVFAMSSS